jgi:hypothetical protein
MTDRLRSQDGRYELVMQNDGNLVVYGANGRPVWASGVDQNPDQPQVPDPPTTPPGANLAPLTIDGITFREDGRLWKYRCTSAFLLYFQWLNGLAAAEQFVKWALSNGFNTVRVFGMINWPDVRFGPGPRSAWDTYIRQIEAFLKWTNSWGLRVEWTNLADAKALMPDQYDQIAYTRDVADMMRGFGLRNFMEACNEPFHAVNQIDANAITPHSDVVHLALGDYQFRINGDEGFYYHRNYFTLHAPRDAEWMRKGGKDLLEITRLGYTKDPNNPETANMKPIPMPALNDEPMGIGVEEPGRRSMDPKAHAEQQAAAMLFAAGSTVHGDYGLRTRVPEGFEQECVWAIVKAWDAVPVDMYLVGRYTRSGMADCPLKWKNDALRVYAMIAGEHATAVVIQPNRSEDFEPASGWQVESRVGPVYNLMRR